MDKYAKANRIFSRFSKNYIDLKKSLQLPPREMEVLTIVTSRKGLYTPVMIADILDVSKSMVAAIISSLEKKEYVYKDFSTKDKRSFYVRPTEKAKQFIRQEDRRRNEYLEDLENQMGEEEFILLLRLLEEATNLLPKGKIC